MESRSGNAVAGQALKVLLFADVGSIEGIQEAIRAGWARGFTTNPTLMRKAGVANFATFVQSALEQVPELPFSLPVLAEDEPEMERQARRLAAFGSNVFVKIPVTDIHGAPLTELVRRLSQSGVQLNVTALLTLEQVATVAAALEPGVPAIVSLFAGRIADTGRDPVPIMTEAVRLLRPLPQAQVLWASPRELFNVFQADACGCQIVTINFDLWQKLPMIGRDLTQLSLETVRMFHRDIRSAEYEL